ncbi:Methyl-CpG-binding domain protein 4 [Quillaja saponaria]|uniref:Methyl-CpG-binding domain protein 4 n=1 Tax=Quillaja saponaria TaxID=32244 RepID=A0AAD7Q6U6_QUISA|nr:Methyl-CpG-binding domain protein 4 [Quillaja saponaria]
MREDPISSFCNSLTSFCNHLQSSCDALKQSVERRPIPLDSASSTFIQCLNRRVSSASSDLDLLESMSFGTVSFEELLGHCNEVYKKNQTDLIELEHRLTSYGYVPGPEIDGDDEIHGIPTLLDLDTNLQASEDGLSQQSSYCEPLSAANPIMNSLEKDTLLDESMSLKELGLSDACLATLASEANISLPEPGKLCVNKLQEIKKPYQHGVKNLGVSVKRKYFAIEAEEDNENSAEAPSPTIKVLMDEFESLPSYLKGLASWEDIVAAVEKINTCMSMKKTKGCNFFNQDEITSFGLGPKARSYLLLLVRMNKIVVDTIDGLISYRVL